MDNQQSITTVNANENFDRQLERLDATELAKVNDIVSTIKEADPQNIIQYGIGAQSKISEFSHAR